MTEETTSGDIAGIGEARVMIASNPFFSHSLIIL